MDVSSLTGGSGALEPLRILSALAATADQAETGAALLAQTLEVEKLLAKQLLQTLGIGGNVDRLA